LLARPAIILTGLIKNIGGITMNKRIMIVSLGMAMLGLAISVPTTQASVKGQLTDTQVSYQSAAKAATFTGQTNAAVKKVVLQYLHAKSVSATVHNRQFKLTKAFNGYRTFKLYGVNKKGKRITKVTTIGANRYATAAPKVVQVNRSGVQHTLLVSLKAPKGSVVTLAQSKQAIAKQYVGQSSALFNLNDITATNYQLTATAKRADRKTSPATKVPVVKPGLILVTKR